MTKDKTKIAILDLTGCTGCQVNLLRLGATVLDLGEDFEISNWRLVQEEAPADFDVVFVEGYACNEAEVALLRQARETSAVLVALGACAISGNIFSQLTPERLEAFKARVYSPEHRAVTQFVRPVPEVVPVDRKIPGCPVDIEGVKRVLRELETNRVTSAAKEVRPPDFVAKIEGHGSLKVDFAAGTAAFYPEEGERYVEALVVGKAVRQAPRIHSRICGICPVAHSFCSTMAIEKALGVRPPGVATCLRQVFACGQMVQSHLLHLYFMVLPSVAKLRSSLEMSRKFPAEFHLYLEVKRLCDLFFDLVGGAPLHPTTVVPGGFSKVPSRTQIMALRERIWEVVEKSRELALLFCGFEWPQAKSPARLLCLQPRRKDEYPLFGSRIHLGASALFPVEAYRDHLREEVFVDSPSKIARLIPDQPIKSGALARLSYYADRLNPIAGEVLQEMGIDTANPFHNNLAQAVEMLHYLEEADRILDRLAEGDLDEAVVHSPEDGPPPPPDAGRVRVGAAAIEAPRGLLLHEVAVDDEGKVANYNIIPPTVLNLSGLAVEAAGLVRDLAGEADGMKRDLLKDLIRAIDPCITCAVH